jgi:hypothetical protein
MLMEVKLWFGLQFVSPVCVLDTYGDTASQEHYVLPYGICKILCINIPSLITKKIF